MTDYRLLNAVEQREAPTPASKLAETEKRVERLIDIAHEAVTRRDPLLLEAAYISFAGLSREYNDGEADYTSWNGALISRADSARTNVIDTFIDVAPRAAAECFHRFIGHISDGFFQSAEHVSEADLHAVRALRKLGDTPEELAFIRSVLARALEQNACVVTDGGAATPVLDEDTATLLKKLRNVPAFAADVEATTRAIISELRNDSGNPESIALFESVLAGTNDIPPTRPAPRPRRRHAARHER